MFSKGSARLTAFLIFFLLFTFGGRVFAATYYVDGSSLGGSCSDSNNGTDLTTPFCTIQKAASTTVAGDTANIRGGTYRETVTPKFSGSSGSPITYQKYGSETPIINGADLVTTWTSLGNDESQTPGTFSDGFEANDLSNYTSTAADAGNSFAIQSSVKNNGTYAVAASFGGTNRNARANKAYTGAADMYTRMYFRVNSGYSITVADTGQLFYALKIDSSNSRALLFLLRDSGGNLYLKGTAINPATNAQVTVFTGTPGSIVPDTWYYVEMRYKGGDASTGGAQFWLNGTSQGSNFSLNTSTTTLGRVEIGGSTGGTGIATNGSILYMDDLKVDTAPIGAFSGGNANIYKSTVSYRINQLAEDGTKLGTTTGLSNVTAGTWYDDFSGGTLYVETADNTSPTGHTIEASHRDYGVIMNSKSYLTFNGINAKFMNYSNGTSENGKGFFAATSSNLLIENANISYNYGAGVWFVNTSTSTITGNTFTDNSKDFGGAVLFQVASNNNTISSNTITGIGSRGGNGIFFCGDDTCQTLGDNYNTIRGNSFYNLFDSCVYLGANSTHNIFEDNICGLTYRHFNSTGGVAGGVGIHVSRGSNNTTIRNNLIYDTQGAGIGVQSDTIGNTEITTDGALVYNNTVYNPAVTVTSEAGIAFLSTTTNSVVRNNIVYQSNAYGLRVTGLSVNSIDTDYNLYYSTQGTHLADWGVTGVLYDTIAALQAATGQEMHSLSVDPLFTNASTHDFTLTASSPAIDVGTTLASVTDDYAATAASSRQRV
jgi:parallel beta-helix repeat protein